MAIFNTANGSYQTHNHTLFEAQIPADRRGNPISGNYFLDIAKGKIPGASVVFISGKNPSVNTSVAPCTVWNGSTTSSYPWDVWLNGANTIFAVSNSALDVGTLTINGLDANYNHISQTITLAGLTSANTDGTKFIRVNSALYQSNTNNNSNHGAIELRYGNTAGTIIGKIEVAQGITSMAIYTVPAGHTAFTVYGDFSVNKNEGAELNARWRLFGGSFFTVYAIELYQAAFAALPPVPGAIPEKTDIDNSSRNVTTNGTRIYSNQQLILIDNTQL